MSTARLLPQKLVSRERPCSTHMSARERVYSKYPPLCMAARPSAGREDFQVVMVDRLAVRGFSCALPSLLRSILPGRTIFRRLCGTVSLPSFGGAVAYVCVVAAACFSSVKGSELLWVGMCVAAANSRFARAGLDKAHRGCGA